MQASAASASHSPTAPIAKIHYKPAKSADSPDPTTEVPGNMYKVDLNEKNSKRFLNPDAGGWGYAAFDYDAASDTFTPASRGRLAAAGARHQLRGRVPHARRSEGSHLHRVSQALGSAGAFQEGSDPVRDSILMASEPARRCQEVW